jgi:hypothetical protein
MAGAVNVVAVAPAHTRAKRSRFRGESLQRLPAQPIRARVGHAATRSKPTIPARRTAGSLRAACPGRRQARSGRRRRAHCGRPAPDGGWLTAGDLPRNGGWHGGHLVSGGHPQRLVAPAGAARMAAVNVVAVAPAHTRAKRSRFWGEPLQRLPAQRIRLRVRHAATRSKPTIPARRTAGRLRATCPGRRQARSGRRRRAHCGRPAPDGGWRAYPPDIEACPCRQHPVAAILEQPVWPDQIHTLDDHGRWRLPAARAPGPSGRGVPAHTPWTGRGITR